MKKGLLKRLISVLLSLLMIISALPFTPITAAAVDDTWDEALEEYEYFISVKTTDDADGWNWANVKLYTFDDDTYTNSSEAKKFDITSDIDDSGEEFRGTFRSTKFLDKVVVNIDFGGGFTWHDWSGELTVKINGTNVISTSMSCGSSPFSSSNRAFSNRITSDKYPKVDEDNSRIYVQSADSSTLSSDLTFYQGKNEEKGETQGYLYAQLVDQYDVVWKTLDEIEIKSNTHPDNDIFEFSHVSDNKAVFNVTSTYNGAVNDKYHSNDHLSKLTLSYPWYDPAKTYTDGSDSQVATIPLEINFKYLHDVKINLNKELFAESKEYEGTQIPIDFGIPAGYRIKSFTKTGAGELVNNNDNTAVLTVGNGDVTVTGNKVANTYYIDYDKNAADATGEMTSTLATYDKASVSIKNSTFNREGYSFLGWNTKPDGTGTAFAGGAAAKKPNLTTENGAHVTLYAQWGANVLTVVLNYPAETGLFPRTVSVNRLLSIEPEEFIDVDSSSGHYRYTGADRSLEKITEDMSVNLYYEKVEHNFGEPFVSVEPTCTTDGVETQMCEDCGYEKHTVIPAYHQDLRTEAGYAATCTDDGAETVIKCYACGEIVENGEVIPAYGHDYNYKRASWSFSTESGQLKGWATVTCKNDKTHTLTVEADVVKTEKAYDFTAYFDGYTATTSLRIGKDIFEINVNSTDGGTVTATPSVAFKNDVVHLNVERESHSYLTGLTATSGSEDIEIEDYSFVMPKGNVEVTAEFSDVLPNQCGDNAFWYYDEETSTLTIAGTGPMYDYDEVAAPWFAYGSEIHNIRKLNIEDGITYIGKCAFSRLGRIVYDVYIADSVTEIGERAFYYSDAVGHLRLSNKLEKIGDYAFAGCDQLGQQFILPETVTSLGQDVFLSNTYVYTVYCLANPENLSWTNATYDFKKNKATYIVVYDEYLSAYQEKFGDTVRGTFIGVERDFRNIIIGESEHGSVSADFAKAPSNQSIRLSAVPDEGYGFSGYVVTDADGNSVRVTNNEFYMPNKDVTVIGIFTPLYGVEIETPDGNGSATSSKSKAIEGATVNITPSPDPGYRFDALSVTDDDGNEIELNGNSFTMPASNVTASVTFVEYTHQVNCTVEGPGRVTGNLYADAGDTVKLTVTPDTGAELKSLYLFDEYGNSIEPDSSNSFTMPDCDVNLIATFEAKTYTITYQATNGTVTGQETAAYGDEVKITAVPDDGYILKDVYSNDWHDISFDKNSSTFIMPAKDITVNAKFDLIPFSITYGNMTNGTVTCSDLTPEPGTTVTVNPVPNQGYYTSRVYYYRVRPNGIKEYHAVDDNKFVMPYADVLLNASFAKQSYPIIDKSVNGSVEASISAEYESSVRCKLVPDDGYRFDSVSIKDIYGNEIQFTLHNWDTYYCDFVMPAGAAIVTPIFVKNETEYSITYSNCENGSVSGPEKSLPGKTVLINNTADEGYILKSFNVKANNSDVGFNEDLSFTMPSANVTVTAEYASNDKCGENAYWKYDVFTKTLTVYGSGAMYDYDGTNMPWYGMDINRVVVETGISYVGAYAFYQSDAETVYMPDSVEKIGSYAFYGSHSLKAVRMSERLTEIDTYAFAYCDALEQLDFPSLLVYVRDSAFTGTTAMDKIWCDMTAYDQLQWGSEPHKLDEFKPNMGTTILVAGALRNEAQWQYNKVINAGFYYTTVEANTEKHSVTVTTDAYGTVKSDFDSAPAGRLVYLTITPLDTYELQSLTVTDANGDEIEVTNNTFIMPGTAVTVNATFARKVYDVVTRPTSNGTVSCAESVAWGSSVPITVTSDEGYSLKSLSVTDVNGNDIAVNNNTFTMPAASVTVSAEFEKQSYGITYRPVVNGSISGPETAERGDLIAINVISESNYKLASLTVQTISGESVSVDGTGFIMPAEPVIVRATFEKIDYDIVYKVSGNGKVTGAKTANYGDDISLTVTPQTGAVFENLLVTDSNGDEIELTDNTFTMPAGKVTVIAKFSSTEYSITYGEAEHGTISGYLTANYDSSVTVNVTPEAGYQLDTLLVTDEEDNAIAVNGNSFTMPASNVSVTATFKLISSKVIYIKTANGAVSGPETAECGNTVSVSPIASVGAKFVSLTVKTLSGEEIELTGNSFTMPDKVVVVKAQFEKIDYPITYNVSQGGTVTGAETANLGDEIQLNIIADTGYYLDELTVKDAQENELAVEDGTFIMPNCAVTVNASFKKYDHSITYLQTENGTVTGELFANVGDEITLSVVSDEAYKLSLLTVKDSKSSEITVTDNSFVMPDSDVTIEASFELINYDITYVADANGTVSGVPTAHYGDEIQLTVTTNENYKIDTITVTDETGTSIQVNDNAFIMPNSNVTVSVTFVRYYAYVVYSENGSSKILTLKYGTHQPEGDNEWDLDSIGGGRITTRSNYGSITDVVIDPSFADARPKYTTSWFDGFKSLTNIEGLEYLNTSEVTNMVGMFYECRNLTSLDLSGFDTSNVTAMDRMFMWCTRLTDVNISGFDSSKVNSMSDMFRECCNLQTLDLGTFNNYNATTVSNMFSNCSNLRTIYVEGSDTKWKETKRIFNYTEYDESMFDNCTSLVGGTGVAFSDEKNSSVLMAKVNGGYFTAKLHSITVEECTGGTLSADKSQATMNEVVTLTAIPDDEHKEAVITVLDSLGNPVEVTDDSFVMPASDVTVSASFVPKKYTVQWKNGSEIVETDNVPYGTIPQFNGEAPSDYSDENIHYTFSGWNDGENTYAVNELPAVTSDVSYTAVYTEAEHSYGEPEWAWAQDYSSVAATFTCTVGGETETVNATVTSENSRDKITYTATAEFEGNTYTDIRVVNKTLSTVTVVPSENGTVTANLSEAYEGEEVMLTVNPNADSKLASLTVKDAENNEITVTDNKFTMPASNVTVTAVFEKLQLINMVEPYIDDEGAYILGTVEHYVDASGTNYAVNNDGSVGSVLESTALSYFDFELMSDGTYRVNHFTGPTANMTELVIPKTFNGKKITVVGSNDKEIFYNSEKTQFDLVLNENITKIDQYTFYVLHVKEVKGDTSGLKTIGRYAFSWANSPGAYEISLDLNYDGTIQTDYCAFNNMKVTFNLKHSTKISFNTPNSQSISYNFTDAHVYGEPVWTWAEDYSSVAATFTCTDSRCNHQENVAATLTSEVTSEQTCTDEGERTHTASVEFNGQRYTDTKNETIPATGVHSYGEPEWTWAQDYSTASATFTCSVGGESTTVDATITSEIKGSKTVYTATAEFNGKTYTDTKEVEIQKVANDIYNLTVEENIDVNVLVDVNGHITDGEVIDYIEYTYPDITTQEKKTVTETVQGADIEADARGYFAKSFTMAVAQANEPIVARVYFTNGTAKDITVSVTKYCDYIIKNKDAEDGRGDKLYTNELVNLCYAVLEYGKNAADYFNYEYEAYPEYTLPEYFNQEVSITSQAGIKKGSVVTGITSTQMFILSKATMRLTFKDDLSAVEVVSAKVGEKELTAVKAKNNGRDAVDISGIFATELNKPIVLELSDGTKVQYSATDWAKSILTYSTNESSKALAKSLYYYNKAANDYFSNQG